MDNLTTRCTLDENDPLTKKPLYFDEDELKILSVVFIVVIVICNIPYIKILPVGNFCLLNRNFEFVSDFYQTQRFQPIYFVFYHDTYWNK